MLFSLFQQYQVDQRSREAKLDALEARHKTSNNEISIKSLAEKVDHLALVCLAMGELLEEVGFSKEVLLNKIEEIDLRDGKLDGKFAPTNKCQSCGRVVAARHINCLYCGTKVVKDSIL